MSRLAAGTIGILLLPLLLSTGAPGQFAELSQVQVAVQTGIEWVDVVTRPSGSGWVVIQLLRPYPAYEGEGTLRLETLRNLPIDRRGAALRALSFTEANAALLAGTSSAALLTPGALLVREVLENHNPPQYRGRGTDYTVVIDQLYAGVRVFEGSIRIQLTQFGEIWAVDSTLAAVEDLPAPPRLDGRTAQSLAAAFLADPRAAPQQSELVVLPPSTFAWHLTFSSPHFRELLLDAATGEILLARSTLRDQAAVYMTVKDGDGQGLPYATGEYHSNGALAWSKLLDAFGQASDENSPAGTGFVRAILASLRLSVKDADSGYGPIQKDSPAFTAAAGQAYFAEIGMDGSNPANAYEGSIVFREAMRAWDFVQQRYGYETRLVTAWVDHQVGPATDGTELFFPRNRAILDYSPPGSGPIDDTILHEYGHAVQFAAYGLRWGRPMNCTCVNHGGTGNDCSFDALVEGWADYFPVMLYGRLFGVDTSYGWSGSASELNIELNSNTDVEERDEWSFAGVLYDIADSVNDGHDTISADVEIWTVMRYDQPSTVEQFFQKFIARYPALAAAVEQIYLDHGMRPDWLVLSHHSLDFGPAATVRSFAIEHSGWYGDGKIVQPSWNVSSSTPWIRTFSPASGSTTTEKDTINVTIDRAGLAPGSHTGYINVAPQYYGRVQTITVTCQVVPCPVPAAPSGPSPAHGAVAAATSLNLGWAAAANADAYDVYFGEAANPPLAGSTAATSYAVGGLSFGRTYYWRVAARNGCGNLASSPVWSFTVNACPVPSSPSVPSPADGAGGVAHRPVLSWTGGANTESYRVYLGTSPDPPFAGNTVAASYAAPGLAANTLYHWKVAAENGCGNSSQGPVWSFTTGPCPVPAAAANPSPAHTAAGVTVNPTLTWAGSADADSYDVYLGTAPNPPLAGTALTSSFGASGLIRGMTYYWKVVSRNSCGNSIGGPTWSFATEACPAPGAPANPSPGVGGLDVPQNIVLSWSPAPNADSYDVYFGPASNVSYVGTTADTRFFRTNLHFSDLYYWRVVARNSCGMSASSPDWYFLTGHESARKYLQLPKASYDYQRGGTRITSWVGNADDAYYDLAFGDFSFKYYGELAESVRISTNGYIAFGQNGLSWKNGDLSTSNPRCPPGLVAPFWDDLVLGTAPDSGVYWQFLGTAPNRRLVIEWYRVASLENQTETYSFEVVLYESRNRIKFQYLDVDSGTNHDYGASATAGIANWSSFLPIQYSNNSPALANGQAVDLVPLQPSLLVDFGPGKGLFQYGSQSWRALTTWQPDDIVEWRGGLAFDFGAGKGLYNYDGVSWRLLTGWDPEGMVNWGDHLVVDFGAGKGLYLMEDTAWRMLSAWDPEQMKAWSGGLAVDFGAAQGFYTYDGTAWTRLTGWDPEDMTAWASWLFVDFGAGRGLFRFDGAAWNLLSGWDPVSVTPWSGGLAVDFGPGRGVFRYNGSMWIYLTSWEPENMIGSDSELCFDFGPGRGLFTYDTSGFWRALSSWDPVRMIPWDGGVAVDFGTGKGLFHYREPAWTMLTSWHTQALRTTVVY